MHEYQYIATDAGYEFLVWLELCAGSILHYFISQYAEPYWAHEGAVGADFSVNFQVNSKEPTAKTGIFKSL